MKENSKMTEQIESPAYSFKVRRIAQTILEMNDERFSTDFEKNKKLVREYLPTVAKQMRNRIAGYIVRLKKVEEK